MNQSDIPTRFPIPFANSAGGGYIRPVPKDHVAASSTDAPASLHDGFPPETFTPLGAGGIPPNGMDVNGLFNQITKWAQWQAAGAPELFDSTFCTAIGGYPKGARLTSAATPLLEWISTVDGNTTDPDGLSAANWTADQIAALTFPAGHLKLACGLIVQWGFPSSSLTLNAQAPVIFPTPFPTTTLSLQITPDNNNTVASYAWADTLTTSGFNLRCSAANIGCYYLALGA